MVISKSVDCCTDDERVISPCKRLRDSCYLGTKWLYYSLPFIFLLISFLFVIKMNLLCAECRALRGSQAAGKRCGVGIAHHQVY
jgi:hypothetical protein